MKPTTHRDATFRDLKNKLICLRLSVWEALGQHGPCTTRELARECGIDLLTVRPRVTELVKLGFAVCEDLEGHEGTYRALTLAEAEDGFNARQRVATEQLIFAL